MKHTHKILGLTAALAFGSSAVLAQSGNAGTGLPSFSGTTIGGNFGSLIGSYSGSPGAVKGSNPFAGVDMGSLFGSFGRPGAGTNMPTLPADIKIPPNFNAADLAAAFSKASAHIPKEHASDYANAVQTMLQKFDTMRDQFIADRNSLIEKFKGAKSDEERKVLIDQLKADSAEQRALGKQIREELKKLREQRATGG
jgi:hypothetical protein